VQDGQSGFYYGNDTTTRSNGRVEVYGGVIYNCGVDAQSGPGGHGFYAKHKSSANGRLSIQENISFNHFAYCHQQYSTAAGGLEDDVDIDGNIWFNGFTLSGG